MDGLHAEATALAARLGVRQLHTCHSHSLTRPGSSSEYSMACSIGRLLRHVFGYLAIPAEGFVGSSSASSAMPRINVSGVDASSRQKFPREFSLLQQLGGEAVDSEVRVQA